MMHGCSMVVVTILPPPRFWMMDAAIMKTVLLASEAPLVKISSDGSQSRSSAMFLLESSTSFPASRPKECMLDALPNTTGSAFVTASRTSGAICVVALLSRYINLPIILTYERKL